MANNISVLSFNTQYLDPILDNYHLGNGYRAYNPTLMQYAAPDDLRPFGKGGINPYAYVSCDPINKTDPIAKLKYSNELDEFTKPSKILNPEYYEDSHLRLVKLEQLRSQPAMLYL